LRFIRLYYQDSVQFWWSYSTNMDNVYMQLDMLCLKDWVPGNCSLILIGCSTCCQLGSVFQSLAFVYNWYL